MLADSQQYADEAVLVFMLLNDIACEAWYERRLDSSVCAHLACNIPLLHLQSRTRLGFGYC